MNSSKLAHTIQDAYRDYEAACTIEAAAQEALEAIPDDLEETPENQKMIDDLYEACTKASELWWERRKALSELLMKLFNLSQEQANAMMASDKFRELMSKTITD